MERLSRPLMQGAKLRGRVWSFRDISERKRKEEALRQSEDRYRAIFEQAVEGLFQSTPAGRFIKVNQALARMCGYDSPEEMMVAITDIAGQHYASPEDREVFNRLLRAQGVVENFEHKTGRKEAALFGRPLAPGPSGTKTECPFMMKERMRISINEKKPRYVGGCEEQIAPSLKPPQLYLDWTREGRITMESGGSPLEASRPEDLIGRTHGR